MGVDFQPYHHALCRKYRECRKIAFLTAVPSVDVELQPFLVDHALPQRDLRCDERVELGRRAVGGKPAMVVKRSLVLGSSSQLLHLGVARGDDRLGRARPAGTRRTRSRRRTVSAPAWSRRSAPASGVSGLRCAEVRPSALSLPARTNSIDGREVVEEELGDARRQVLQGRRRAAIGDVLGLGAGELQEPGARQVRRLAGAGRGVGDLAVLGLQPGDELRDRSWPAPRDGPPARWAP